MSPLLANRRRTRIFFDWLSLIYDAINPHIYTEEMRQAVKSEIQGDRILDVGVGTGYTTRELENAIGIDLSRKMLYRARDYKGSLIQADATLPPFKQRSFDTIICAGSFYYFPSPVEGFKVLHSLLKEGGLLLCLSPSIYWLKALVHVYKKADLEKLLSLSGYKVEKIVELGSKGVCYAYFSKARK
jgi:SAM-dependent methyltransferase